METRNCQNCKNEFRIEAEDFDFYAKIKVPPPTFCPHCRMLRRLAQINHRSLYKRDCSLCGKSVPSMYHPESPFIVYCTECYFSDKWDPMDYGRDYDFRKPFFPQFYELLKAVPQLHIEHTNNNAGNVFFSNYIYRSKNIYLSYGTVRSEDIYYSWGGENANRMCLDSINFSEDENCYDLVDANKNYNCAFLTRSHGNVDSYYLFDCHNCTNCFMSGNLRNKSYVFRNVQLTQDEYKNELKKALSGKRVDQNILEDEYKNLIKDAIHRFATLIQSENCIGDFISNSKNVYYGFSIQDGEDCKYAQITTNQVKDCYDFSMSGRAEHSYEFAVCGRGNNSTLFSFNVGDTAGLFYCDGVNHIQDSFGCVNVKHKQFCIFNKQYSKEEYEALRDKIITQMKEMPYIDEGGRAYFFGEFFPFNFSRFHYNESAAFELFPVSKEDVLVQKLRWRDVERKEHSPNAPIEVLEGSSMELNEDITSYIFPCKHDGRCNQICSTAFRITKEELNFYKKFNLALPDLCPNCRYFERQGRVLPWKLWHRGCMCKQTNHGHAGTCPNEFETAYAPGRQEIVYCESCYQKEVI